MSAAAMTGLHDIEWNVWETGDGPMMKGVGNNARPRNDGDHTVYEVIKY